MQPTSEQLARLAEADPRLGAAMARVPEFPNFSRTARRFSGFHYLCRSIIYQQLAGAAAKTIYGRVRALTPGRNFPLPRSCWRCRRRSCGARGCRATRCSRSPIWRAGWIPGRFGCAAPGGYRTRIVERLTEVRGIGGWTAQMFLLFKLGRLDVMPATDLGVREGLRRLDGLDERPAPKAVLERSEVWKPLRSVASWVLWRLTDTPAT